MEFIIFKLCYHININTPGALQQITGDIFIQFDFVKYKSDKPDKVY